MKKLILPLSLLFLAVSCQGGDIFTVKKEAAAALNSKTPAGVQLPQREVQIAPQTTETADAVTEKDVEEAVQKETIPAVTQKTAAKNGKSQKNGKNKKKARR